jgi:hypothetical protein
MVDAVLVICVLFCIIYALAEGCTIKINITTKQEFSQEDRALLEDLYNKDGDPKSEDVQATLDEVLRNVNAIMLGDEENTNG